MYTHIVGKDFKNVFDLLLLVSFAFYTRNSLERQAE